MISEGGEKDVFVRSRDLGSAVHGDRVTVRIEEQERRGPRGTIIDVVERRHDRLVGILRKHKGRQWLEVTEPRLDLEVFIPNRDVGKAEPGDVIVVEVMDWGDKGPGPAGRVDQVLGRAGDPGLDVLAIQIGFGLANQFPKEVEDLAKARHQSGIRPEDLEGRKDCRTQRTMTIDPADAKDHDDAISIEQLKNGNIRIGVHIADVSHYVHEGDSIDSEAWERGTSVYLVDRVLPMLPHSLSNDSCSLVPGKDRLTMGVFFEVDGQGLLKNTQLAKAVIKSAHKLSYEDAQSILDGDETEATSKDPGLRTDLKELLRTSELLRQHRHDRGSIDFDLPESHIVLNADGVPIDVQRHERTPAHMLVEDLMIATNEAVANWAIEQGVPLLYRIHEDPDDASLETLRLVVAEFGYSLPTRKTKPRDFQRLIDSVNGRPEQAVISVQVLRSLSRARYSRSNEGHFGLASSAYVHFTSPIRRYPDLVAHRQLSRWLKEPRSARSISLEWLDATAQQASSQEQIATEAARDSVDLKKVEFMERHLGDHFTGTISGVTPFGFFVRLDSYDIEGLIHISNLGKDYFVHDDIKHALKGRRTKTTYTLGDAIEVQVNRVDREARRIDLMPLS